MSSGGRQGRLLGRFPAQQAIHGHIKNRHQIKGEKGGREHAAHDRHPKGAAAFRPGADSLDMVELIMIFEEQFKIRVTDELASQIKTVKQAANAVETLLERKNKEG